ncbi:hypothetical protein GEMRC1_007184 [Eukaryota sp. GEM-RC1]
MHAGLTIAEKGCIIQDFFEKEVRDFATVEFQGPVDWRQHCDIRGGRNSSLVFNDILIVKDGGKFENYIGRFRNDDILLMSSAHQTPDDLPVVCVNHGMELYASGWSFEFDWELQNRGNITVPQYFVMKLFSGGYDSASSRVFFEPDSYLEVGAPYPYHYDGDTWVYYNRSTLEMKYREAHISYDGYVCFDQAKIGPFGTLIMSEHATICAHSSLSVDGTIVIVEGDAIFCDLTLNTDYFGRPGTRLTITCSLIWLSGTFSGGSIVHITTPAKMFVEARTSDAYHEVHEFTSILNDGYSEVTTNLTGFQSANFTNFGQLDMVEGHWVKQFNSTESVAVLYNSGEVNVLKEDILLNGTSLNLLVFSIYIPNNSYIQKLPGSVVFLVTKDLIFDDCDAIFDSSHLTPLENSSIVFMSASNISWNNVPFTFDCDTCDLTFASNTVISRSPNTFTFRSGLLTFLDVSTEFIIDKFIQTGGTLVSNPASDIALLDDYELHNGLVITNSDWTAKEVEWRAGTFTGPQTFTSNEIEIRTNGVKVCDADLVFDDALFSRGTISGTAACTITTTTFLSKSSPATVSLTGCSSTFIIEGVLTVETGTLSFRMGYLVNGLVDVISKMVFESCETVQRSSRSQWICLFNELSQLTGEQGGTLTINHDAVVSGTVNFEGCVHVSAGVELSFVSAQIDLINICTNRGDVTFIDSFVDSINVLKLLNGHISFNNNSLVSSFVLEEHEGGTLTFNTVTVDSFDVLSISGGLIDFAPTSSVIVNSIVQSNGLINVNSLNTVFNRSNFTSTGGVLQTFDGFNVSRSVFVLDGGEVIIDQFDPHHVNIESLIINSGSFITIVDQMFNSSHVLMTDGYFGGVSICKLSNLFEDGPKNFDEGALVASLIHTTWFDGSVVGTNYSRLVIPVDTNLNLFGTEGWFVPEEVEINSAIHSEGHVIFSTPETITMQWDIYGPHISVLTGTVIFKDNLVLVDDVYLAPNTTVYLKGEFNVSDSIAGGGDIYIDDPDSLVAFNGLVNLTGVLYMRDGLLDLRLSDLEDVTIVYTGGIILFREDIRGSIIRLPEVRIDLDISDSDLELVHIGICDAPITVKEATIARFIVNEMTENCVLSFLNYAIVAELEIDQMNGGELNFGTDSDVKLVSITVNDGVITAEPDSSPSFSGGDLLVNGGAIVFKENASVSFVNVKTVMTSGSFNISTQGTDGCPHWEELSLSNDAQVFIDEPHCVSSADIVEMQDESQLTSTGDLYIDDFSLIGGSIGDGSPIHVIDNFSATTDQPKNFGPGSVVFINSTGDFTLSQGYEDQVTTFGDGAVVYVAPEGSLLISSNDTAFHYATDCDSCKIPTGFVSEGSVIISTPIKSVFDNDIVSTGHLAFENNTISDLNGRVSIDGSTFIRDQAVVTVTGSIHQLPNDVLTITPGTEEGRLILDSKNSTFSGEILCERDLVCITITSGNTIFTDSMTAPEYINFEVIDGDLFHQGVIEEMVCDLSAGSFYVESGSTVNVLNYCKLDNDALLQHQGGSFTNRIDLIDIYDGTHQLLSGSTVTSHGTVFNLYDDDSLFESQTGSNLDFVDAYFTINKGKVFLQKGSTSTDPHFSDVKVYEGEISIDILTTAYIDNLLLKDLTAVRSGSSFINVTNEFVFTEGSLIGNGTTYSHNYLLVNEDSVTQTISDDHTLLINHKAEFTNCNIIGSNGGLVTVLPQSHLDISGKCSVMNSGDSNQDSLLFNEGLITTNHDDVHFDWDLINNKTLIVETGRLLFTGTGVNNDLLTVLGVLDLQSMLSSTDHSRINGSADAQILMTVPSSLLNVTGFYEVYGEITINDDDALAYFNSDCKVAYINANVIKGTHHISSNCVVDELTAKVSGHLIADSHATIHLISSLTTTSDGKVNVNDHAIINQIADVTMSDSSSIHIKDDAAIDSSLLDLTMTDTSSFLVADNVVFTVVNGSADLTDTSVFEIVNSVDANVDLIDLYLRQNSLFNVSCDIPIQVRNFYHLGGHRSGVSDVYVNSLYRWSGGKLSSHLSTSTTIVTSSASAELDATGSMNPRNIENHLLLLFGDATWTASDTTLVNGVINVTDHSTFLIDNPSQVALIGDDDSHLYVHGHLIKDNSGDFVHNCPTFVDGAYLIKQGNVYTQKPVIVSRWSCFDFVFIDDTSILNGTSDALITLKESSSLLNVTGFYEVYGEITINDDDALAYFNSDCRVAYINANVIKGALHISSNCVVDEITAKVSGHLIADSHATIHLISSLTTTSDGKVNIDDHAIINQIADVIMSDSSSIHIKDDASIDSSLLDLTMTDTSSFLVADNVVFTVVNGSADLTDTSVFEIVKSVDANVDVIDLHLKQNSLFNVSCDIPIQVRNFYHHGGHRSGDSDVYVNSLYHWSGGKLSSHLSTSTTIVTSSATSLLDATGSMNPRIIDDHLLLLFGDATWTTSDTTLVNGVINVTDHSTFLIDNPSQVALIGDDDSHLYVHGHLIKDNSGDFVHNCPTFVDGAYLIKQGNVYTQKPVIVSDGLASVYNGHLYIEDFVFIDDTSILNGTSDALITLKESSSLLNVTGFYEVYGEITINDDDALAYFNSDCKVAYINANVIKGTHHISSNCFVDEITAKVSGHLIADSHATIHLISSITTTSDGKVNIDDHAIINQIADVTMSDSSSIHIKDDASIDSSLLGLTMTDTSSFLVADNVVFTVVNGSADLTDTSVFEIVKSVDANVDLIDLYLRRNSLFNVSCDIPIQVRNFYHLGGHRSGDSDVYVNSLYHWSGGKLSSHLSTSTTIVTSSATSLLDATGSMNSRIIDDHLLLMFGDGTWTHSNTRLVNGVINVTDHSTFLIDNPSQVRLIGDDDSHLYVHGHLIKDNSGDFIHNCPTFVDGAYLIKQANVYTQKPVIVSDGLASVYNGHLYIEDFVFIDDTSILNGTSDALITLKESSSLLNVTGFYEVYGEITINHDDTLAYFNSDCRVAYINANVITGTLHISSNCVVDELTAKVSGHLIADSHATIHLISSLTTTSDGKVNVNDHAIINQIADVTMSDSSSIHIKDDASIDSSLLDLTMTDTSSFLVDDNVVFTVVNGSADLTDTSVFEIVKSAAADVDLIDLYLRQNSLFNVSCDIPIQVRNFYHLGGHRSGDSDVYVNSLYHWSGGKLSSHLSTSTTIVTSSATAELDATGSMNPRIIDDHLLLMFGNGTWTTSDTTLVNGVINVTDHSTFLINNPSQVRLIGDDDSNLYVHGHLIKETDSRFLDQCPTTVFNLVTVNNGFFVTEKITKLIGGEARVVGGTLVVSDIFEVDQYSEVLGYSLIHLDDLNSNFTSFGHFNSSGSFKISLGSASFTNHSLTTQLNLLLEDGFVSMNSNGRMITFTGTVLGGELIVIDDYFVDTTISLLLQDGLVNVSSLNDVSFVASNITVYNGEFHCETSSGCLFSNTQLYLLGHGLVVLQDDLKDPHFAFVQLTDGTFTINQDWLSSYVEVEHLLLNGGLRSGLKLLNISRLFEWTSGSLSDNSITYSHAYTLIHHPDDKFLKANHSLVLRAYSLFAEGKLICGELSSITNTPDSLFVINGTGEIIPETLDNLPVFYNKPSATILKYGCSQFDVDFILQNEGLLRIVDPITDCSEGNIFSIGPSSWSSGVIILEESTVLSLLGTFKVNESSLVTGEGEFRIATPETFVTIAGVFNHSGDLVIIDAADDSNVVITDTAVVVKMNLKIFADGTVLFDEYSYVPLLLFIWIMVQFHLPITLWLIIFIVL